MNKKLIIPVVVAVLIVLGIGGYLIMGKKQTQNSNTQPQNSNKVEENNGITGSVEEAFMAGQSIQCNYTDTNGRQIIAFMKNNQVRTDIISPDPKLTSSVIIKDKKMYYWNAQGGTVMEIPDTTITVTPQAGAQGSMSQDEVMSNLENYKQYCKQAAVTDDKFTPPADIKFQDMSKMTQPAMPSGVDQAQVQELMKKYATPTQ